MLLAGPYACAELLERAPEDFAVPTDLVRQTGISEAQLVALLDAGIVRHETAAGSRPPARAQRGDAAHLWAPRSRYTLTPRGMVVSAGLDRDGNGHAEPISPDVPHWSARDRELTVRGEVVKRFLRFAPDQQPVLDALERLGWPAFLHNPFAAEGETRARRRLVNAVKCLNRRMVRPLIRFVLSANRDNVGWRLLAPVRCATPRERTAPFP
jgi:hypothetical protein